MWTATAQSSSESKVPTRVSDAPAPSPTTKLHTSGVKGGGEDGGGGEGDGGGGDGDQPPKRHVRHPVEAGLTLAAVTPKWAQHMPASKVSLAALAVGYWV